jgi:hypothetical protein
VTENPEKAVAKPPVTFTLDGIQHTVEERRQTAGAVLRLGGLNPADYDLLKVVGQGKDERYQDDQVVEIVPHGRYLSFFTGPTPVQ